MKKIKINSSKNSVIKWTKKIKLYTTTLCLVILTSSNYVFADEGGDGSAGWNTVMDFLLLWIPRLGAVMLFGGALEYVIAYATEQSQPKIQATRFMVAGAMTIAIPLALASLLKI